MSVEARPTPVVAPPPIPTAPRLWLGGSLLPFRKDPLAYLRKVAAEQGDVVRIHLGPRTILLISDPELIREILVNQDRSFTKGPGLRVAERLLGKGLLTSEGDFHRRQRRLAQPAFHRARIAGYGRVMVDYTEQWQRGWSDGAALDLAAEMRGLTLRIAAKTLFDTEVASEIDEISEALDESLRLFQWANLPFSAKLERFLPFMTRSFNRCKARLDETVFRMIRDRRASGEDRGDLLSMLLLARDEEADGEGMSDLQIRDECMTLLLAGHETTANAFAWTFYLLAQHPEIRERLEAELDSVLEGGLPTADHVPELIYTRMVFSEAMRLYPPAWVVARQAAEEVRIGLWTLPEGTLILMSEWVVHHDARWYPDPLRFDPERWAADAPERPRFAYFPFGGGSRLCIGEQFAWMEGVLVLATLASRWRFRLTGEVTTQPLITLRPRHGVPVMAERRAPASA
jgi:cytochrome P450